MRVRRSLVAAGLVLAAGCSGGDDAAGAAPQAVTVQLDRGTTDVVGTGAVRAAVEPGSVVTVHHAGRAGTHLLTSAAPSSSPPLFSRSGGGAVPNAAVWGACLGGAVAPTTRACPVPPVDAPTAWDGEGYLSLGSLLAGETRRLRLGRGLSPGRSLRLWCRLHPTLEVRLDVVRSGGSRGALAPAPPDAARLRASSPASADRAVAVAPRTPAGELLAFAPGETSVPVGGTVTWRRDGPAPHSVELVDAAPELGDTTPAEAAPQVPVGSWDGVTPVRSGFLSTDPSAPGGTTFSLRFGAPGRYRYWCRFHPGMSGTVLVRPA